MAKQVKAFFALMAIITMSGVYTQANATLIDTSRSCTSGTQMYGIDFTDVTYQSNNSNNCYGAFEGNNDQLLQAGNDIWNEVATYNVPSDGIGGSTGDLSVSFNGNEYHLVQWSYTGDTSSWDSFLIVLKASNSPGWAVYQFDSINSSNALNGNWYVAWSPNNNGRDGKAALSHLAIYSKQSAIVSEPAPLALLAIGLLALTVRRKK